MIGQMLEEVTSFKFLGATRCKDGTCFSRSPHWDCLSKGSNGQTKQAQAVHQFASKFKLFKSFDTSHLPLWL